jgi:hypothetical protein
LYAAVAASLKNHVDGTGKIPVVPSVGGDRPLTAKQVQETSNYEVAREKWDSEEAIIKQAVAAIIPDSLFLEVRKKETAWRCGRQ